MRVRKRSSARSTAPGTSASTRPARASWANVNPPRYAEPRSATSRRRSGSPSKRETRASPLAASRRQTPAFPGRNESTRSNATAPSPAYARAGSALSRSTIRSHSPRRLHPRLGDEQEQRVVDRDVPRLDPVDEVDAEQV